MSRKLTIVLLVLLSFAAPAFAQEESEAQQWLSEGEQQAVEAQETFFELEQQAVEAQQTFPEYEQEPAPEAELLSYLTEDTFVPHNIRNNEFFLESLRLTALAQEAFNYGDYDASYDFAQEAIVYARLSDEYVANQLIAEAQRLLYQADRNDVQIKFPNNYNEAKNYYESAVQAREDGQWDIAIDAAIRAIEILSVFEILNPQQTGIAGSGSSQQTAGAGSYGLARQYTVRTWIVERDCLWNIAGYPWVYGDPARWVDLYEANKSKLPDPNNPDWIEPGMVLDIPNIGDERRQGMWSPN